MLSPLPLDTIFYLHTQMFLGLCLLKEDQKNLLPPVWLSVFKEKLDKAKRETLLKCIGKTSASNLSYI